MSLTTMTARDSKLSSARSKGTQGDSTKTERAAFTRSIRRAGRVSVRDAMDACEDEQDDQDEIRNVVDRADAMETSREDIEALYAAIDAFAAAQAV